MKSIKLSKSEILIIKSFVHEMTNILAVECVYLVPYLDNSAKLGKVEVIVIKNDSLSYKGKLTGKETMRDTKTESDTLKIIVKKFKEKFKNSRLTFSCDDASNYSLTLMHNRELISEKELASGIILFDRFGDMEKNKQQASSMLECYSNILQIENIDQILNKKNQVLKKTK